MECKTAHDLSFTLLNRLFKFRFSLGDLRGHPLFDACLEFMGFIKWEVSRSLEDKHVRMEGESDLGDLDLRIQISVVGELLV